MYVFKNSTFTEIELEKSHCWLLSRILSALTVSGSVHDLIMQRLTSRSRSLDKIIFVENYQPFIAQAPLLVGPGDYSLSDNAPFSKQCYDLIGEWAIEQKDNSITDSLLASIIRHSRLPDACFTKGNKSTQQRLLNLCFQLMRSTRAVSLKAAYLYVALSEQVELFFMR